MNRVRRLASPWTPRLNTTGPFSPPTVPAALPPDEELLLFDVAEFVPEAPLPVALLVVEEPVAGVVLPLPEVVPEVPEAPEPLPVEPLPEDWPLAEEVLFGITGPRLGTTSLLMRFSRDR